ncbi:MAG: S8 family serine peptidase [Bacteroidota bacterium]|nr:S8 family serine peptidase [Candidatus Kapabacteria bacterium]MDW8221143.1 S8 family serine peptidase [Bacteroidota bacterium]
MSVSESAHRHTAQESWQAYAISLFPALSIPTRMRSASPYSGKGVCIAMIDSGFVPHPDLTKPENRILRYYDAVDCIESDLPPSKPEFYSWHGTMTACTAAGNGILSRRLYSSLAYNAHVVLIRTMDEHGSIPTARIVHALEWCLQNARKYGINIINLSVYADELDTSLEHPVTRLVEEAVQQGIVVVAASGNNPRVPLYPPACAPSAITVGGLDDKNSMLEDDSLYHSSFGRTIEGLIKPEVIAPAIWLPAPILPGTPTHEEAAALTALDSMLDDMMMKTLPLLITKTSLPLELLRSDNPEEIRQKISERLTQEKIISPNYKHVDGTSFAAPIVCSVIAQMLEANDRLTPAKIKEILTLTAKRLPHYPSEPQGYGVVQATAAVEAAATAFL